MMLQRRTALQALGLGLAACAANVSGVRRVSAKEGEAASLLPNEGHHLRQLSDRLAQAPRQRSFKTVPMILNDPEQWDAEALKAVIAYPSPYKQVWDNTDLGGPWLNLMRIRSMHRSGHSSIRIFWWCRRPTAARISRCSTMRSGTNIS
jgi:hypothetical protein